MLNPSSLFFEIKKRRRGEMGEIERKICKEMEENKE